MGLAKKAMGECCRVFSRTEEVANLGFNIFCNYFFGDDTNVIIADSNFKDSPEERCIEFKNVDNSLSI